MKHDKVKLGNATYIDFEKIRDRKLISNFASTLKGKNVLEIGCGEGRLLNFVVNHLVAKHPRTRIHALGCDPSPDRIKTARIMFPHQYHPIAYGIMEYWKSGML